MEEGWSVKQLHRRIMLSATYQQTSAVPRAQLARDPDNHWLGRFSTRRLEAESIRDAMIFVTGRLDLRPEGPAGPELGALRRSLYVQTTRFDRDNFSTLFDAANPDTSVEKRNVSTVAPQALLLLNHEFVREQAAQLAKRLLREAPGDETGRIHWACQLLFGRPAKSKEFEIGRQLLAQFDAPNGEAAWRDLAHVLLCTNEFIYVD